MFQGFEDRTSLPTFCCIDLATPASTLLNCVYLQIPSSITPFWHQAFQSAIH